MTIAFKCLINGSTVEGMGKAGVIADFATHGASHLYGLPCPSTDSLDPMDHFCTFEVSNIIPKNMHDLLYVTFKAILTYICGFDP